MTESYTELKEENPKAEIWEGFEQAYLGYGYNSDNKCVAVYDYYTMLDLVIEGIEETMEDDDMLVVDVIDAAIEHIQINVIGRERGGCKPLVIYKDF
tara:strand:- start:938 stop:1228 length:291 start_codon:yes stop_codon:yes gene_type:complete